MVAFLFRRRRAVPLPEAAAEKHDLRTDEDEADDSPLGQRLRQMSWPTPPDEVRERCFEEIMSRVGDDADAEPPSRAAG